MNKKNISFAIFFCASLLIASTGCANHYAVLISTNEVLIDDQLIHSEWWYDLFNQYKMLRELGYEDNNIYVLYGSGVDFNTLHDPYNAQLKYGHAITDKACNKSNIKQTFEELADKIGDQDYLYVWWMGHGSGDGPDMCDLTMTIHHTGEIVSDTEFAGYLDLIRQYKSRWINVMTCHSGGIIDNLTIQDNRTITFSSSTCEQLSYDKPNPCNLLHAEFNYDQTTAYRTKDPCDTAVNVDLNSNSKIEIEEAFKYLKQTMSESSPQKTDPNNLAGASVINADQ